MIQNQPSLGPLNVGIVYIERSTIPETPTIGFWRRLWNKIKEIALYEVW